MNATVQRDAWEAVLATAQSGDTHLESTHSSAKHVEAGGSLQNSLVKCGTCDLSKRSPLQEARMKEVYISLKWCWVCGLVEQCIDQDVQVVRSLHTTRNKGWYNQGNCFLSYPFTNRSCVSQNIVSLISFTMTALLRGP